MTVFVEQKQIRIGPYVSTIMGYINGDIAHDADPELMAIRLQLPSLPEKLELAKLEEVQLGQVSCTPFFQCSRIPHP